MQKIDYARIIAEKHPARNAKRQTSEQRAASLAGQFKLPLLRAWAATYVAETAEERETAAAAMRAEDRDSLLGPAPKARLHAEVEAIHRRARERAEAQKDCG